MSTVASPPVRRPRPTVPVPIGDGALREGDGASARAHPSDAIDVDAAWTAVASRDRSADGAFVYAVRTTGIYCRPSCPARRPRREHVAFLAGPAAAESAGFRACRRCRPTAPRDAEPDAVARARAHVDAHVDAGDERPLPLAALAAHVGLSPAHLQRVFTRAVGLSPRAYRDARRVARLKTRLRAGDTVSRATVEAGFAAGSGVYARADRALGMTPAAWRRGGAGERVAFATASTRLGRLLVAATARGVCAVALGDDDAALAAWLRAELPAATLARDDAAVGAWVEALARHLDAAPAGDAALHAVPLDLAGTAFQQRVWRALREIPFGATRSYAELAREIGRPGAARAVARACASNRVALVVPCHRVVRADGDAGGYRWGAERKAGLLAAERAGAAAR